MVISILECGAAESVDRLQTAYIQKAIDTCFLAGGGEVVIPKGNFSCGGIRLRSNVTLHLLEGARLVGSRNLGDYRVFFDADAFNPIPDDYLPEYNISNDTKRYWYNGFIVIYNEKNVAIIGEKDSVIDGQNCYNPNGEENFRGPHCITVMKSENVTFKGYTVENSSNWAHSVWTSKNILVENVSVIAGHDGVHFTVCDNITVRNCQFYTGDDCIAGCENYNVLVEDCILNCACNAFRFSGKHVCIQRCQAFGPAKYAWRSSLTDEEKADGVIATANENRFCTMRAFFAYFMERACKFPRFVPSDIVISDCTVENPQRFISYVADPNHPWYTKPLGDITFKNITAKGVYVPMFFYGFEGGSGAKLVMENCDVSFLENRKDNIAFKIGYFDKIELKNVITNCTNEDHIAVYGNQIGQIIISGGNVRQPSPNATFKREEFETTYV